MNQQEGLWLREGDWVYKSLILVGWSHEHLMAGRANLCKVFWTIMLGVPTVGAFNYLHWTFTRGPRLHRATKIMALAAIITLIGFAAFGPSGGWSALGLILLAAIIITMIYGIAFLVLLFRGWVDDRITERVAKLYEPHHPNPQLVAIKAFFRTIWDRITATKKRICPPILFRPQEEV